MSDTNITPPAPHADGGGQPETTMSTPETLSGILFEPGRTFEALRERPRFLVVALISLVAFMGTYLFYIERIGYNNLVDAEISIARKTKTNVTEEQLQQGATIQKGAGVKAIRMWSPILIFVIIIAAGAGLYLLGTNLMGGKMSYKQALAVWTYASLPPLIITAVLTILLLFVSPPESDTEIARGLGRGLVHANPGAFVDPTGHPVIAAALGSLDLIAFYGLFLAALGLRKVGRLSSGAAWTIVLVLWGLGVLVRVGLALAFGRV
jgi:hypothetical protein